MSVLGDAYRVVAAAAVEPGGRPERVFERLRTLLKLAKQIDQENRNKLLRRLTDVMERTDPPRAAVLALGCGTLVEWGCDPVMAFLAVLDQLRGLLQASVRFHDACARIAAQQAAAAPPPETSPEPEPPPEPQPPPPPPPEEPGEDEDFSLVPVDDDDDAIVVVEEVDEDIPVLEFDEEEIADAEVLAEEDLTPAGLFGPEVAKKMPREAAAWKTLDPMCRGALAMLARSSAARRTSRDEVEVLECARKLAEFHPQVRLLARMLQVLDDEELVVLHPARLKGYKVKLQGVADNAQLHTLLVDAVVGNPDAGWLPGSRPDPRVVAAAKDRPVHPQARSAVGSFNLWTWRGLKPDGKLPEPTGPADHWIAMEGIPADIPMFGENRVILLGPLPSPRSWNAERPFPAMPADLTVTEKMPGAVVRDWIRRIARAVT